MIEFDYTVKTSKDFNLAGKDVQNGITKAGLRVLHTHDVQATLSDKGFERDPFKIIEFCNARYANDFLNADIKIGLCMPCKINVYVKDGETYISGMRPVILTQFFPQADLKNMPQEIDQIILKIINSAK